MAELKSAEQKIVGTLCHWVAAGPLVQVQKGQQIRKRRN